MSMLPEHQMKEAIRRWGSITTVIILSGICLLSLLLNYQFASASSQVLDVSIQANRLADYGADSVSSPIPVLKMQIIEDVMEDQEPTNVVERLEVVQENLQTVVPTVTPTPTSTKTPVPGVNASPTSTPLPTEPSGSSAQTSTVTGTSTPVSTADLTTTPGETPTATATPQGTDTNTPAATDRPTQTSTKVPTSTPTATKKLGKPPTATKKPTKTPLPPPTATRTPPPPPTATKTQPPQPTATDTPTKTPPPPPTATMTPTSGCYPPDPGVGFISSTTPFDGAVGVPLDITVMIQFNQAMYTGDLFKNIKVSGTKVDYVMSYDPGTHQVEIDFLRSLKHRTKVTVEIKRSVKNSCQQQQLVSVKFEFRTVGK
jgi:hypothetical protein